MFTPWQKQFGRNYATFWRLFARAHHETWFSTHPKTASQFTNQYMLGAIFEPYKAYMVAKSLDEKNKNTMDLYNLSFKDIKYPWLSGLNTNNASASLARSTWQFSRNMSRLYK